MRSIITFFVFGVMYCCYGLEESESWSVKRNGYAFYYPVNMNAHQLTKVCLAIDKHLLPAVLRIKFEDKNCFGTTCQPHNVTTDFSCWEIMAPAVGVTRVPIVIETSDGNVKFHKSNAVQIHQDVKRVIFETDRSTYKMGDTVKIRILAVGFDLKPIKDYEIPYLRLRSPYPASVIIKEWRNVSSDLGLVHLEFQLAPDTSQGIWKIHGADISGSFEVKKYILARFQATIKGPQNICIGADSVSYTVCGIYSYGKHVNGKALLSVRNSGNAINFSHVKKLTRGCANFEISRDLHFGKEDIWLITFSASVTEDGTEQVESATMNAYVNREPYDQRFVHKSRYIKPKLPHMAEFVLSNVQVPLDNPKVKICYQPQQPNIMFVCSNIMLGSDNKVKFVIPPITDLPDDGSVIITAEVIYHPLSYKLSDTLMLWHSKSKNGISIIYSEQHPVDCESTLECMVLYNSARFADDEEVEFKYILTSRGDILNTGTVRDKPKKQVLNLDEFKNVIGKENYDGQGNPIDKFMLKIKLDKKIYTDSKLVVYYDYDGEVISDVIDVDVNKCAPNLVKAKWMEESLYPGEVGNLNIKADKGSLCSVSSIDKASTFLGSSSSFNIMSVVDEFHRYFGNFELNCMEPSDPKPDHYQTISPDLYDSSDVFQDSAIGVISNLQFISKTCKLYLENDGMNVDRHLYSLFDLNVDQRGSAVRSFFPETWLWDLVTVHHGETNLERKLPDSITTWQGNVVCMSSDKGFGVSDKIEIQGFKPFFVDILLPYSIKRNKEILHLPISVFNYLNHSLPVRVTLKTGDGIVLVDGEAKNSFTMCLGAEDSYTQTYRIKATKLGFLNITVSGLVDPAYVENCAPDTVIRRRDVVQKSLLVEPEGYPSSLLKSVLLCANDSSQVGNIKWDIILPENIVPDAVDGKVTVNSDILGPMFQNLENILAVPSGCGEQTMATLTPNLYVLQYLEANDGLTDQIREKILKNLEIGYQRMLTYTSGDGSFSAFGRRYQDGSMFLTAFVIRTFKQMQKYIFIDDSVMKRAINWITSHQLKSGCFDPVHHVFQEMGLASSRNQTTALTSYVLISLLETNTKVDKIVLVKAKECILNDSTVDKYTLAISSYALALLNRNRKAKKRLNKLLKLGESKDGQLWWRQSEKSQPANVETSSYVLISLLRQDPVANLGTASSIVRWLQTQMNQRGAFYSTTDTVVGLDAISRYAASVAKNEPNVKISLATKTDTKEIEITKRDRTRIDSLSLTEYPNEVKAKITGDGCVSIQAAVNYYLDTAAALDDLKLEIGLKPVYQKFKCSFIELKPCVSYSALGRINMAIVEVNMPSGYAPDQVSLYDLRTENDSGVKKFEIIRNQVVFYLTQLGAVKVCLPFTIKENLVVENVANATVKFYDYYKPEVSISKSFKLEDCQANINVPA